MTNPTDLPDLPDLPDDVDLMVQTSGAAAVAPVPEGERALRRLDKAPLHLRTAAVIVLVGCLIPFMGHGGGWMTFAAAKVVVFLGAWLVMNQFKHDWGPPLTGLLGSLAKMKLGGKKKDEEEKPKRRRQAQAAAPPSHPWTALEIVGIVVAWGVGCIALPFFDPTVGFTTWIGWAEVGMLAWAAFTWVHIYAYERGRQFNPLFPLMFLGILFAGISRVVAGIAIARDGVSAEAGMTIVGGLVVAIGGGLAAYTIVEAMREAKREGDEKKRAAAEARMAARRSSRGK